MRTTRLLGSIGIVLAAAFVLSGCSLLPAALSATAGKSAASLAAATPAVGDCWNATDSQADAWADWKGTASHACSSPHTLYTYAVGKVTGESAKSWAASGSSGTLSDKVSAKAAAVCDTTKLLPALRWNQQLIQGFFFVPTEAEWKNGARWVRCDVGVLAFGASITDEQLAALPSRISTMVAAVASDPKRYEFCVNSPIPVSESGPLDNAAAQIADCRKSPQWALAGHGTFPEPAGAAFPSSATANSESATICAKFATTSNEIWIGYLPSRSEWAANEREVECWVGQKAVDTSGGIA